MPLVLQHNDESAQWGVWRMDETFDELCCILSDTSYPDEVVQRFSAAHRRVEWLSVRAALKQMLQNPPLIAYHPSGKPYLKDSPLHISISHTKGYVAVIVGHTDVGIDIEQYGERIHKVSSKFMRDDETVTSFEGNDTWSLLLHWSAKEVMFKCMNTAAVDFKKHLFITPFTTQAEGTFHAQEFKTAQQRSFLIHYLLHPHFVLTYYKGNSVLFS